jgi:hypothetical protein
MHYMSAHLRQHDGLTQHIRLPPSERAPVIRHVKTDRVSSATLTAETLARHTDMATTTAVLLHVSRMTKQFVFPGASTQRHMPCAIAHYRTVH